MKRRNWILSLFGIPAFAQKQQTLPTNKPVCPFGHRDITALNDGVSVISVDSNGHVVNQIDKNFCNQCGCVFVTVSTPSGG